MKLVAALRLGAAAAAAVVALPAVAGAQTATAPPDTGAPPTLGGWTVTADANALDVVVDSPAGLAGEHPISELDLPEAYTDFETGPFGTGRAAVLYPGSVLANFGTASGQLNFGIPSELQPVVGKLNDPVVAVASYPGGPSSATYPSNNPTQGEAAEMTSAADENGVGATSSLQDTNIDGLISVNGVKSTTSSAATNTAEATATTSVSDVSILGGLIEIKGLSSTTSASSNGTTATVSASTTPATVLLAGYQIGVDNNGINLGPVSQLPLTGGLITDSLNQLISTLGLKITLLPQVKTVQGSSGSIESAGLQVSFTLPASLAVPSQVTALLSQLPSQFAVIATLPQVMQQATFTFTLGRSTSNAEASPPFNVNLPPTATATPPPPPASAPPGSSVSPATTGNSGTGGSLGGGTGGSSSLGNSGAGPSSSALPSVAGDSGTSTSAGSPSPSLSTVPAAAGGSAGAPAAAPTQSLALDALPISLSSPVGAGAVALLLCSTVVLAYGLRRLAGRLTVLPSGPPCPLEEEQL